MFQKLERSSSKGYQLFSLGPKWELHTPSGIVSGTLHQICNYAVLRLGFKITEIEFAVIEMEKQFHDAAEFGIYKSFIFTFDRSEKYDKGTAIH